MTCTFLLIAEHPVLRHSMEAWLITEFSACHILSAATWLESYSLITFYRPQIILTNLSISSQPGFIQQLNQLAPQTPVVVISMDDDDLHKRQAFEAGAAAYISQFTIRHELTAVIKILLEQNSLTDKGDSRILSLVDNVSLNKQK